MTVETTTADRITSEYLRRCHADERLRSVMLASRIPASFKNAYELLPRPLFADRKMMDALGLDLKNIFEIITSLPERLFDNDHDKYCSAIGIDEQRAELISRLRNVEPPRSGRADLHQAGAEFKILEFNVNTGLGGADMVELHRALMATEPFAGFAREFHLDYTDTMAVRANMLRDAAATIAGSREPVIAAIEADGAFSTWSSTFRSIQHSIARYGIHLIPGELSQLKQKNGRVYLDGKPLDLILRYFMVDQLVDDAIGLAAYEMICRAHDRGQLVLHTPPASHLFNDKATLALLSDRRYRNSFSAVEQDLIDRMIPWTRLLREGWTQFDDGRIDLIGFSIENQRNLILKPNAGFAATGVVAGWESEKREWEKLLRSSVGGPFIIQHRVDPDPEPIVDLNSGRLEYILPAWGVFFSENGYDGGFLRAAPHRGAVIDFAANPDTSIAGRPGTRRTGLLTCNG